MCVDVLVVKKSLYVNRLNGQGRYYACLVTRSSYGKASVFCWWDHRRKYYTLAAFGFSEEELDGVGGEDFEQENLEMK